MFTPTRRYRNVPEGDVVFFDSISYYDSATDGHFCEHAKCYHHLYSALYHGLPFQGVLRLQLATPPLPVALIVQTDVRRMLDSKYGPQFCGFQRISSFDVFNVPEGTLYNKYDRFRLTDFPLGLAMANESLSIETVIEILILTPDHLLVGHKNNMALPPLRELHSAKWKFSAPDRLAALKALFTPVQMLVNLRLFCQLLNGDNFGLKRTKIQ